MRSCASVTYRRKNLARRTRTSTGIIGNSAKHIGRWRKKRRARQVKSESGRMADGLSGEARRCAAGQHHRGNPPGGKGQAVTVHRHIRRDRHGAEQSGMKRLQPRGAFAPTCHTPGMRRVPWTEARRTREPQERVTPSFMPSGGVALAEGAPTPRGDGPRGLVWVECLTMRAATSGWRTSRTRPRRAPSRANRRPRPKPHRSALRRFCAPEHCIKALPGANFG